ncbi:hypothetical protein [Levilactobacillus zymae]|nr:hypothetical protein [Levilactobacillus zymae]MDT6979843.1 hypothetical protein [Levilactobacillus zymae]
MINVLTTFYLFDSLYYLVVFAGQIAIIIGIVWLIRRLLKHK